MREVGPRWARDPKDSFAGKRAGFLESFRTGLGSPSSGVGGEREAVGMQRHADRVVDCRSQLLASEAVGNCVLPLGWEDM